MNDRSKTRNCPLCKEEINPEAIKCKHCGSSVAPEKAPHEGTCPYCKEEIHPEAIKCKHCKSNLTSEANYGCGDNIPSSNLGIYSSMNPSTGMLPQSDSDSIAPPPFSGEIVANKVPVCRKISDLHKLGNWLCSFHGRECCDAEYVCYEPVGGGKQICVWKVTNCSTTPTALHCTNQKPND